MVVVMGLGVEGEDVALVASHEENGRQRVAHGLQPTHVQLARDTSLWY